MTKKDWLLTILISSLIGATIGMLGVWVQVWLGMLP